MANNDARLLLKLPQELKDDFDACAADIDLTTSQLLRKLMREYVAKNYKGDLFAQPKKKRGEK